MSLICAPWLVSLPAGAQETNVCLPPATRLGAILTNTGTVIIKAIAEIGSVRANTGLVLVKSQEVTETGSGQREYGLAITVSAGGGRGETVLLDYEEIDPVLNALDYLNKVDWSVTSLPSFNASYSTKDGFRMAAFSSRRNGTIEFAVRLLRPDQAPVLLSRDLVAQLRALILQAKNKLDSVRPQK